MPLRRRPLSRLAERAIGRLLFRPSPRQPALVRRLRSEAAALDGADVTASELWDGLRLELRHLLLHGDVEEFLRWRPIRTTMVSRNHDAAAVELTHLRSRRDWRWRWRPAIRELALGGPRPLPRHPWTSAATVRHAYHAARFDEATGRPLEGMARIVEFGGGYGRLCRLVHDLGFTGSYVIFDLPELGALQRFYLGSTGLTVRTPRDAGDHTAGVLTLDAVPDLERLLRDRPAGPTALVAIGSLSESPPALRSAVLSQAAAFDAFWLFYVTMDGVVDNRRWFASWRSSLTTHDWVELSIPHIGKDAWYLAGRRRS